jgi:hypothetical protein
MRNAFVGVLLLLGAVISFACDDGAPVATASVAESHADADAAATDDPAALAPDDDDRNPAPCDQY